MGNIDSVEATALLAASLKNTAYTPASTWFVALDTVTPVSASVLGTELAGYTRQAVIFSTPVFGTPTAGLANTSNTAIISFTSMPAATITAIEIFTTVTGTTRRLWWGPLVSPKTTNSGDTLSFAIGAIAATLG